MKKKEEMEGNFKLPVFHYEREITQTHSTPFNFLIIKVGFSHCVSTSIF